ncbi:MAG: protein tyrosine phosphatase family protein [Akkermansiaceae bacterium]
MLSFLQLLGVLALFSSCIHTPDVTPRPESWAAPIREKRLPNLHKVSDSLYRCGLPGEEGYVAAEKLGIQTIINLRPNEKSKQPSGLIPNYVNIPVQTGSPSYDQVREFFRIVDTSESQPILLHCFHGADRTGAFTALYRINREGWDPEDAIQEMTGGGFHFHAIWKSLIDWVREAPEF